MYPQFKFSLLKSVMLLVSQHLNFPCHRLSRNSYDDENDRYCGFAIDRLAHAVYKNVASSAMNTTILQGEGKILQIKTWLHSNSLKLIWDSYFYSCKNRLYSHHNQDVNDAITIPIPNSTRLLTAITMHFMRCSLM